MTKSNEFFNLMGKYNLVVENTQSTVGSEYCKTVFKE